jgi:hypothetical protein
MKTNQWPVRAFIFVSLLQALSCTKTADLRTADSISLASSSDATVPNEFANCKLRYIVHRFGGDPNGWLVYGLFTYNAAGNPFSLTYGNGTGTGNPNHYFFYDKKNRLREYRIAYSPDDPVEATWHRYGYDNNDVIVVDTAMSPPLTGEDGQPLPRDTVVTTLSYDDQGRIIKESIRYLNTPFRDRHPTYTYDNRGNLGVIGWKSSWYDTKVSFVRSHPLFMFLTRNYSRSNPYNLEALGRKYNSKKLPLSLNAGNDEFFNTVAIEKFIYDCQ